MATELIQETDTTAEFCTDESTEDFIATLDIMCTDVIIEISCDAELPDYRHITIRREALHAWKVPAVVPEDGDGNSAVPA
jgi:hypothetical protein